MKSMKESKTERMAGKADEKGFDVPMGKMGPKAAGSAGASQYGNKSDLGAAVRKLKGDTERSGYMIGGACTDPKTH